MPNRSPLGEPDNVFEWTSLWTAARGQQVIHCDLIVAGKGRATLRCGYGPRSVIRSQFIASERAAAEVAETWKTALVEQGFRVVSRIDFIVPSATSDTTTAPERGVPIARDTEDTEDAEGSMRVSS